MGQVLADLTHDDHLIVPPRDTLHFRLGFGTRARAGEFADLHRRAAEAVLASS